MEFRDEFERIWREQRTRVLATLIRLLGGWDAAEEATQEAFAAALAVWPASGIPANPAAWLVSTGRHKAIDRLRRQAVRERREDEASLAGGWVAASESVAPQQETGLLAGEDMRCTKPGDPTSEPMEDDRLRLIFTCCHPALGQEAQVALTLRTLGGLSTEAIARAYLKPVATLAQRLVRAKAKIRDARIPYRIPQREDIAPRLEAVLLVVYLIFNEGYGAEPNEPERQALCAEALRLGRLLLELLPREPEVQGLLALMLLQHARAASRYTPDGDVVLLEDQDRDLWDADAIREGCHLAEAALRGGVSLYGLQAAIAALHAQALRAAETDWPQIVALYDVLLRYRPSPVIELNRAVAVAMRSGADAGLLAMEPLAGLEAYCPYWAAMAQMLLWTGALDRAADAYRRAQALACGSAQQRFFQSRMDLIAAQLAR